MSNGKWSCPPPLEWDPLQEGALVRWYGSPSSRQPRLRPYHLVRVTGRRPCGLYVISTAIAVPKAQLKRHGRWKPDESAMFEQIERHVNHEWTRAACCLVTRSVSQIRTHAQKYYAAPHVAKSIKRKSREEGDARRVANQKIDPSAMARMRKRMRMQLQPMWVYDLCPPPPPPCPPPPPPSPSRRPPLLSDQRLLDLCIVARRLSAH